MSEWSWPLRDLQTRHEQTPDFDWTKKYHDRVFRKGCFFSTKKDPLQPIPAPTYRAQHEIFKILKIILEKSCPEDHAAGLNVELINGAN